jgi:hypothetical protein
MFVSHVSRPVLEKLRFSEDDVMRPEESCTPVIEEETQRTGDRREGNLIPGDIFFFKEAAFKRFRSRGKIR